MSNVVIAEKDPEKELNVELGEKSLVAPILKNKDKVLYTKHKSFKRCVQKYYSTSFLFLSPGHSLSGMPPVPLEMVVEMWSKPKF